jgi:hypothetical protein
MGRPRKYATDAERQRAYRERKMLMLKAMPQVDSTVTKRNVTKSLPRFYTSTWGLWHIEVSRRGRPRQWFDDESRKRAWWMRKVARQYRFTGFWADEAARIARSRKRTHVVTLPDELREAA